MKKPKPTAKRIPSRLRNKQPAFLIAFRRTCNITDSALQVGIDRSMHYQWMREDAKYAAAFTESIPEAGGALEDDMVRWARVGVFEPIVYKGKFQFAPRNRTLCKLADGTTAFDDELPKGAKVIERKTVRTADGEMLGRFVRSERLMEKLAVAWMPDKYGTRVAVDGSLEITSPEDARQSLFLKLTGLGIAAPAQEGDRES